VALIDAFNQEEDVCATQDNKITVLIYK
jgi:hypothetical protein